MSNIEFKITEEKFKEIVLELEKENMARIRPNDRKKMVANIMKQFETFEVQNNDNK